MPPSREPMPDGMDDLPVDEISIGDTRIDEAEQESISNVRLEMRLSMAKPTEVFRDGFRIIHNIGNPQSSFRGI